MAERFAGMCCGDVRNDAGIMKWKSDREEQGVWNNERGTE